MKLHGALTAALMMAVLAAGCAEERPERDAGAHGADDQAPPGLPPPPAPEAPGNTSVPETLRIENETRTNFLMTGCLNPRLLFVLEPEYAQSLLPPGFEPADVTGLVQFTGAPIGSPAEAGQAVAGYDLLSCAGNSLDGQPASFSQVGVMVKAPDLGNRTPVGAAMYDLYLLGIHTDRPAWLDLLRGAGFGPGEAFLSAIQSGADEALQGNYVGAGRVAGNGTLAEVEYGVPSLGRDILVDARYWHVAGNGTFYFDFHLSENVRAGPIATCTHAAGSVFEKVSGTTTCGREPRFAAVGIGAEVAGTAYWLPGIFPAA